MIYQLFFNLYQQIPDAIAIVTSEGKKYTFDQVYRRVNQWANYFIEQGIEENDRVGVLLDNEDEHLFIFLALDRINATYVPFDSDIPTGQLNDDIETVRPKKFIIEETLRANYDIDPAIRLVLDETEKHHIESQPHSEPARTYNTDGSQKIAYISFSSGSSGKKKAIPILGAGLVYWEETIRHLFAEHPMNKMLCTRSPGYDARIYEYVQAFATHSEIHLLNRIQRKDFTNTLAVCKRESISCILLIADQLHSDNLERIIAELASYGIKHLMVTGSECSLYLKKLCEFYEISLWNCYGPTEATFGLSILRVNDHHPCNSEEILNPIWLIPIGKPYGDVVRYHIDENSELCIESPYLTPGYLNPAENEKYFKYMTNAQGEKIRVFKTGDKFREYKDRTEEAQYLFYEGRVNEDSHCKIDGVKVTSKSIQDWIQEYASQDPLKSIIEVEVVIKSYLGQNKPHAYLVVDVDFNHSAYWTYLQTKLNNAEMPRTVKLNQLPRLATSGKVDRQELIRRHDLPEEVILQTTNPVDQTQNATAKPEHITLVQSIWCELFKLNSIPLNVEFKSLGGKSLLALEMVAKLNQQLDTEYTYSQFLSLKHKTIQSVANSLVGNRVTYFKDPLIHPLVFRGEDKKNIFFIYDLTGNGNFNLAALAERMAKEYDCNIYGLSDPAIFNKEALPVSMKHAVHRNIRAIKTIQEHGRRFHILGFSFGAIMAYEMTYQLWKDCYIVSELHLVDGFPAYVFQALSDEDHLDFLELLIQFMITQLTGEFYQETLEPIALRDLFVGIEKRPKQEQIDMSFDYLIQQLKNPASINMITLAKRHLSFILNAPVPEKKLPWTPTLYLTNQQQPYHKILERLSNLSEHSVEKQYLGWSRYFFNNIIICGNKLIGPHLSVLDSGPPVHKQTADCFFSRENDSTINMQFANEYGPRTFYRSTPLSSDLECDFQLSVYFLNYKRAQAMHYKLSALGLTPVEVKHDQSLQKCYDGEDTVYSNCVNLFCYTPRDKFIDAMHIIERGASLLSLLAFACYKPPVPSVPISNYTMVSQPADLCTMYMPTLTFSLTSPSLSAFSLAYTHPNTDNPWTLSLGEDIVPLGEEEGVTPLKVEADPRNPTRFFKQSAPNAQTAIVPFENKPLIPTQSGSINLLIYSNNSLLLTLSFQYHGISESIITAFQQQLKITPMQLSGDKRHITYEHKLITLAGNIYDIFYRAENFLADFISLLAPYAAETKTHLTK